MIPLVDLQAQFRTIQTEIEAAMARVLRHGRFILGDEVGQFETSFAVYCGARYGVGVASGTAALHLALLACGVGSGDEVITSPLTFAATAEAICYTGARPVFADIDPDTYTLDPASVEAVVSQRTRVILPVHLYGHPADMDRILSIARRCGARVIEDAAQAHGATYRGRRAGSIGDAACFSFYPGKNLGAYGDGGMVVTSDPAIAQQVRMLRDHGRQSKYVHQRLGYGERLDALQAAVLSVKLPYLEEWNERRRRIAGRYREMLAGSPVRVPREGEGVRHVYYVFVVRVPHRDAAQGRLRRDGIGSEVHYPLPLHLQPALAALGYRRGQFPHAERAAEEVLSLPLFPEMTDRQVEQVAQRLVHAVESEGVTTHVS